MAAATANAVIVFESADSAAESETRKYSGLLSADNFLWYGVNGHPFLACIRTTDSIGCSVECSFFLRFLPQDVATGSSSKSTFDRMQSHVERGIRKVGESTLRDVLQFFGKGSHPFQCIRDDEAFFNVLLRFACGAGSVAVLADAPDQPSSVLLGTFSVETLLGWIEEDLTLFRTCFSPILLFGKT